MPRRNMKAALASSLQAEDEAVKSRFEKAESLLGDRSASSQTTATPPAQPDAVPHIAKEEKPKVVRDSFTLPVSDYELIAAIRQRCLALAIPVNKGEVVRAGLHALQNMSDEQLLQMVNGLEKVKTGRPASKS